MQDSRNVLGTSVVLMVTLPRSEVSKLSLGYLASHELTANDCAGFQTDIPGASIVLMVTLPESEVSKLSLGYLASYEGMGWAQVECLGACSCHLLKIDANSTARASQEHFASIDVERQNDGDTCLLKVSCLNQSSSVDNGHKFKVSSVAWTGDDKGSKNTPKETEADSNDMDSVPAQHTEHTDLKSEPNTLIGSI